MHILRHASLYTRCNSSCRFPFTLQVLQVYGLNLDDLALMVPFGMQIYLNQS